MPTALVTGASSGIGLSFARQLAGSGHDLVVVARDTQRLESLAKDLGERYGTDVEVLSADLTAPEQLAAVEARLADAGRPVDVLINNAGFGNNGPFVEHDRETLDREMRLNVVALTRLAHAALPGMVARRRGGVVNVASVAAFQPVPGTAVYGATKAFVLSLSQALHEELRGSGVKVVALCPGYTKTEFQERNDYRIRNLPSFAWETPEAVAEAGLRALRDGRAVVVPGAVNKVLAGTVHALPRGVVRRVSSLVVNRIIDAPKSPLKP
jgi:short-subunit dehydrogenase